MNFSIRFQISVFADASAIDSGSRSFMKMANAFDKQEIVPAAIQELMPNGKTAQRLSISPRESGISINILHNRVDAVWPSLVPDGNEQEMSLNDFIEKAVDALSRIFDAYFLTGSRLALICEFVHNPESDKLGGIRNRLNPVFSESLLGGSRLEWATRQVFRTDSSFNSEQLNIAMEFSEAKGEMVIGNKSIPINGVRRQIDVNTLHENATVRFAPESLREFCEEALSIILRLDRDFDNLTRGGGSE